MESESSFYVSNMEIITQTISVSLEGWIIHLQWKAETDFDCSSIEISQTSSSALWILKYLQLNASPLQH